MNRRLACLATAIAAGSLLVTALATPPALADDGTTETDRASATQPVEVTVPLRTLESPGRTGMNGVVEIRLGRSEPFLVMLDTGSVGLRVFPGAWSRTPRSVRISDSRVTVPARSGDTRGFLARAPFTIGGVTSTRSVGFQYVDSNSAYIGQWARLGVYGILGIGTGRYNLSNPLATLPGSVGQHWSIRFGGDPATGRPGGGSLVLGAQVPAHATATFSLPPLGPDAYGALLWDDHKAAACWTFGPGPDQCVDTWFDSGFDVMRVAGSAFARVPLTPMNSVRPGTAISVAASGSTFTAWRFRAGPTRSFDFVRVVPRGRAHINTGNAPYFQYTVTYDVERGLVSLSHPSDS